MAIMVENKNSEQKLHTVNNVLTILVITLGIYLIFMPLLPIIQLKLTPQKEIAYNSSLRTSSEPGKPTPKDNRLVIPQMDFDATIHEGPYASTLNHGVWHRPQSSSPDKGGNTVFAAHRFTYRSNTTFYHLDKLKVNDKFVLFWEGREYDYKVRSIKVVPPTMTSIEDNTTQPILTLYTCTPLWTSKERLVVVSDLIKGPSS